MPTSVLLLAERAVTLAATITPTPRTVLDVGAGYGKYGVLLREYLDPTPEVWGVEAWPPYVDAHRLAGIYDRRCKSRSADSPIEEGLLGERGAIATSGFGDGVYDVHAAKKDGRAVKLRIAFLEEASPDRTKPAAAKGGRRYAANVHFAVGETLEHSKFGSGVVTSVTLDGKIVVAFDDGTRTLVHKPTA